MTLKRLAILLAILIFFAGIGIAWLWEYAYSPQGRARVIIAQLKGDNDTTLRGWLLRHHLIRPGYVQPEMTDPNIPAAEEMVKLGPEVLPVVIEALQDEYYVQLMAVRACGKFRDPSAIEPLAKCMRDAKRNFIRANPNTTWDCEGIFQLQCVESMADMGREAYGPLVDASKEFDSDTRGMIPVDIAEEWGLTAVPHLMELLEDSDRNVRVNAACGLARLKDKDAIPAITKLLNDPDADVRKAAAAILGKLDVKAPPASQPGKPSRFFFWLIRLKRSSYPARFKRTASSRPVHGPFSRRSFLAKAGAGHGLWP